MACCKHCEIKLNLVSEDNYVIDKRTNDVYCSNGCMLKHNNTIPQKRLKKDKRKNRRNIWECPECSTRTSWLPWNKECSCGSRLKQIS